MKRRIGLVANSFAHSLFALRELTAALHAHRFIFFLRW
jgi:hypothetical protein